MVKVEGVLGDTIDGVLPLGARTDEVVGKLARFEDVAMQGMERWRSHISRALQYHNHDTDTTKEPLCQPLISNKTYTSGYDPSATKTCASNFGCIQTYPHPNCKSMAISTGNA
jgi:hypothetical protein